MSDPSPIVENQAKVLRRLYLTLFLRGRSSRGLNIKQGSNSIGKKLGLTLGIYALIGCMGLSLIGQSLFSLSIYLHAASLFFVGMFVASSSGELLFNEDEAEILLHRPVSPRAMLWAKVSVLLQVSLWLSLAFNLAGVIGGGTKNLMFMPAHVVSSILSALFCTAGVVLVYQLCLRWFGRERLDGIMTMAQVVMTLLLVLGSQLAPRLMVYLPGEIELGVKTWWLFLLPPVWFAALDQTLTGSSQPTMWILAATGIMVTGMVLFLAFGKLAQSYQSGLQILGESAVPRAASGKARWLQKLIAVQPLRWWLRDPVERAGFQLVAAYMFRDRDVKLRLYPGIAPMVMMPVLMVLTNSGHHSESNFILLFGGSYVPLIPMLALNLLRFSQHWQAADVFRITPSHGPGRLMSGARKAVDFFLALPALIFVGAATVWLSKGGMGWIYILPGMLAIPVYSRIPCLGSQQIPLSMPGEAAKAAGRGLVFLVAMLSALALGGMAAAANHFGYLPMFLLVEGFLALIVAGLMDRHIHRQEWARLED